MEKSIFDVLISVLVGDLLEKRKDRAQKKDVMISLGYVNRPLW